jgi:hypothetical protein
MEPGEPCDRPTLYRVACHQEAALLCVLLSLLAVGAEFALPAEARRAAEAGVLLSGLLSAVVVYLLASRLYGRGGGLLLGLLALLPCPGLLVLLAVGGTATLGTLVEAARLEALLVLLAVNNKAAGVLTARGIRLGLLGADLSALRQEEAGAGRRVGQARGEGARGPRPSEAGRGNDEELCSLCGAELGAAELGSRVCQPCREESPDAGTGLNQLLQQTGPP